MEQMTGLSALHWVGGATAPPGGFISSLPLGGWNPLWQEDEVDAYSHLTGWPVAYTDEPMEMDLDGPEYYAEASSDSSMRSWPWYSWPSTYTAQFPPSPASTIERSAGGTPTPRCRRRRRGSISGVDFDTLPGLAPGGLGRVLDQKRTQIGLRQQQQQQRRQGGASAASRRQRLQTTAPRESHVNKSPSRGRRKSWGYKQLALYLDWIQRLEGADGGADSGWCESIYGPHATVGMTNMEQDVWDVADVEMVDAGEEEEVIIEDDPRYAPREDVDSLFGDGPDPADEDYEPAPAVEKERNAAATADLLEWMERVRRNL